MNYFKNLTLKQIIKVLLEGKYSLSEVTNSHPETLDSIINEFHRLGYYTVRKGCKMKSAINMKNAADFFIENGGYPLVKIIDVAKKFKVAPVELTKFLETFHPKIPTCKKPLFNENIFDSIDTEEKAYWLGFIFADGTISSSPLREDTKTQYQFELSLSSKDKVHLEKFAKFINYTNSIYCDNVRCRLSVYSKHFWNVLNCNGCTPNKSLTLQFPKPELFLNKSDIVHFIRGYVDGDGCLSWCNKEHTVASFNLLGTTSFLESVKKYLNIDSKLSILHSKEQSITKFISLSDKKAFKVCYKLYNNSTVYLDRKYEKFVEYCRLYKELYKELESNIGESCDANPEIITEINKSVTSYSVEDETNMFNEYIRCKNDPIYFIENYLKINGKSITLNDIQKQHILEYNSSKSVLHPNAISNG